MAASGGRHHTQNSGSSLSPRSHPGPATLPLGRCLQVTAPVGAVTEALPHPAALASSSRSSSDQGPSTFGPALTQAHSSCRNPEPCVARRLLEALAGMAAHQLGDWGKAWPTSILSGSTYAREMPPGEGLERGSHGPSGPHCWGVGGGVKDCALGIRACLCLLWVPPLLSPSQMVEPITLLLWAGSFSLGPHEGRWLMLPLGPVVWLSISLFLVAAVLL